MSLAKLISNVHVTSIDVSNDALEVAKANAERNGVTGRISFIQKDILDGQWTELGEGFHILVSNPPYISVSEYAQLDVEVKNFEPNIALADNGDGLKFYRYFAEHGKEMLIHNGFIAVEHAYNQSDDVQEIFHDHGWSKTTAIKDYGGHFRCVIAERSEQ